VVGGVDLTGEGGGLGDGRGEGGGGGWLIVYAVVAVPLGIWLPPVSVTMRIT
jgi:hypothetical protein